MKPAAFDYERPATMEEAGGLLNAEGIFAKAVAGCQSLGPMLNLRLAQPDLLVDITGIAELVSVSDHGDMVALGACITHSDIEDGRIDDPSRGFLPKVAGGIAYRAVRNRGTIGGSLAHADPAADWISALPLLDAGLVIWSPRGPRRMTVENLMVSSFTTTLESDELIQAVTVPKLSQAARWGFCKFNQKAGEFAHAIGAVLHDPEREMFRAVIGAIEAAPIVVADASALFGGAFGPDLAERIDGQVVDSLLDGKNVTDPYIRKLALVMLKRAASEACAS